MVQWLLQTALDSARKLLEPAPAELETTSRSPRPSCFLRDLRKISLSRVGVSDELSRQSEEIFSDLGGLRCGK